MSRRPRVTFREIYYNQPLLIMYYHDIYDVPQIITY